MIARRAAAGVLVSVALMVAASLAPATASADSPLGDCPLALVLICKVLPIAPDLDHDIDLTQPSATDVGIVPDMPTDTGMP